MRGGVDPRGERVWGKVSMVGVSKKKKGVVPSLIVDNSSVT